ncbi:MAG: tryptophan halogenase [Alteromonadaceae bacterium]|nr:MAG: tryptophan halogenase [Alteromonadaceae bacterium]
MNKATRTVVILGGGSAGWLTAGVIAAEHRTNQADGLRVILVESPDVAPIGVGEGTWPTMRNTLSKIGVRETDLFRECEASFKQGAKFSRWVTGEKNDHYYHPLVIPDGYEETDLASQWLAMQDRAPFADTVCFQGHICEKGLAPKQITTPEYASVANYAYHLNSAKLGEFLKNHCIDKLGVKHVLDHVISVKSAENGDISALATKENGDIEGDLFVDCSGFSSLLLAKHYKIPFVSKKHILFNDTALAVHVPYENEDSPIASHTISTAQSAGWIWDIGLPSRRGVGSVYSSAHQTEEGAGAELRKYIAESVGQKTADSLSFRKIPINPGHREKFWHRNCVAVGMASGFLEPLEASALVLIELAAEMISENMPATRDVMDIVSKRYNKRFLHRWDNIIDFLKLHYILTKRTDSEYWRDNLLDETIPDNLQELLKVWRHHPPTRHDFPYTEEVFPSASWQYVLYGMGFETEPRKTARLASDPKIAQRFFESTRKYTAKCIAGLPNNRELIKKIHAHGLQRI